jgi:hypothetical protein
MEHFRESANHDATPETLFLTAGSAVQAMENYNRNISAFPRKQGSELQCIVSMLFARRVESPGTKSAPARH